MDDCYAAGLFDGEGWVRIGRWPKPNSCHIRYNVAAGIGMTYRPVIEMLQAAYGGSIHENRHDLRNPQHRIQFSWHIGSQTAAAFLRRVLPHLIVKREQAEVALALQEHIDNTPYIRQGRSGRPREDSDKIREFREELYLRIKELKEQSFPSLTS